MLHHCDELNESNINNPFSIIGTWEDEINLIQWTAMDALFFPGGDINICFNAYLVIGGEELGGR